MRRRFLVIIVVFTVLLSGCTEEENEETIPDFYEAQLENIDLNDFKVLYEEDDFKVYERIEYSSTPVSSLRPFYDNCERASDIVLNYVLLYNDEYYKLVK